MTSCVSVLLLVFLCSSITADDPTGLRVRITDRGLDALKRLGVAFLEDLEKKPRDFLMSWGLLKFHLRQVKLTHLSVNPHQVAVEFQKNSGLQFKIRNLDFTGELEQQTKLGPLSLSRGRTVFRGRGVNAKIRVDLKRSRRGRLMVKILDCEFRANHIITESTNILWRLLDFIIRVFQRYFTSKICPIIQAYIVPHINSMLENVSTMKELHEGLGLWIDYSLSGDVTASSTSLDVPFKGLVFRRSDPPDSAPGGQTADPEFTEASLMAYVGVSDLVLKSTARALYRSGPFQVDVPKLDYLQNTALERVGLPVGPAQVELREAPTASVSPGGVSVHVNATAQSVVQPHQPALPVACQVDLKVGIKGHRLILHSNNVKCDITPQTALGKLFKVPVTIGLNNKIKGDIDNLFGNSQGLPLPLPEGVDFTQGKIDYHHGFLVVGGDVAMTSSGRSGVLKAIGE